ncbi:TetR/AcrR family transcriptional regulator [Frankia sp. R82]|uniref:TetR/AcrR family transcriptional regulator n=1 Tax=Frankia sp. R82 TaxID=2950553 RepID=UPI002042E933|nr:TetR/AcrR family transcriptional regulator [Frankia sp. R82]MCM3886576.1 TetR/AcrR family transcriptional regulator [Frankia sp. R82]
MDTRSRVVEVAARLLRESGPAAVTTRGVAEAAGVQAPAIYRLFGDKDGLIEAVAEHVMTSYVAGKAAVVQSARAAGVDPLEDLRAGWDAQIAFGLANPSLFWLLGDPDRVRGSAAARAGRDVLAARVRRVAATGRLKVSERRAGDLIVAAAVGAIQTLLATTADERDPGLAAALYDAVLAQILTDPISADQQSELSVMVAFRAVAPTIDALSAAERQLVVEWLDRAIAARER